MPVISSRNLNYTAKNATGLLTDSSGCLSIAGTYQCNSVPVLGPTYLGTTVVNSSLKNLGTLSALNVVGTSSLTGPLTVSGNANFNNCKLGIDDGSNTTANMLDCSGNINSATGYYIKNTNVLSSSTLGAGVTNSSLTSLGTLSSLSVSGNTNFNNCKLGIDDGSNNTANMLDCSGNINTSTGYYIGNTAVLSSSTIGAGVTNSSLTSLGTLSSLSVSGNTNFNNCKLGIDDGSNNSANMLDCSGNINSSTGYYIGNTAVLSSSTIGAGVTNSSLTSVGTLKNLNTTGQIGIATTPGSSYLLDVSGNINTSVGYFIGGNQILDASATVLNFNSVGTGGFNFNTSTGSTIATLSNTGNITASGNVGAGAGQSFKIGGVISLSGTGLGSSVVASSLTSVGNLTGLTVNGSAGIGKSSNTTYTLDVSGNTNTTGAYYVNGTQVLNGTTLASCITSAPGLSFSAPSSLSVVGSAGIGKSSNTSYTLDVSGNTNTSGAYYVGGTSVLNSATLSLTDSVNFNYTTLPTYNSTAIGYTLYSGNATGTAQTSTVTFNFVDSALTLVPGTWFVSGSAFFSGSGTSTYTISRCVLGFSSTSATLPSWATGINVLRTKTFLDTYAAIGATGPLTWPQYEFNQVYVNNSGSSVSLYGVCNLTFVQTGGSGNMKVSSTSTSNANTIVTATRIA